MTVESGNAKIIAGSAEDTILLAIHADTNEGTMLLDTDMTRRDAELLLIGLVNVLNVTPDRLARLVEGMRDAA